MCVAHFGTVLVGVGLDMILASSVTRLGFDLRYGQNIIFDFASQKAVVNQHVVF